MLLVQVLIVKGVTVVSLSSGVTLLFSIDVCHEIWKLRDVCPKTTKDTIEIKYFTADVNNECFFLHFMSLRLWQTTLCTQMNFLNKVISCLLTIF